MVCPWILKKNSEEQKCYRRRFCGGKKVYGTAKMDRTRKSITTAVSSQKFLAEATYVFVLLACLAARQTDSGVKISQLPLTWANLAWW
jgi:hypothetical protein